MPIIFTMLRELVLSIEDLRYMYIRCDNCKAQIVFDLAAEFHRKDQRESSTPIVCPSCGAQFDSAIKPSVENFRSIFQSLLKIKGQVGFRVSQPVP